MKRYMAATVVLGIVLAIAATAGAQMARGTGEGAPAPGGALNRLDTNGDGLISSDEWRGNQERFKTLDANGDGQIDSAELEQARAKMQERNRQRQQAGGQGRPRRARLGAGLFEVIDTDDDEKLSAKEISEFATKIAAADEDGDGFVSREEAGKALRKWQATRLGDRFVKRYDKDEDGKVTVEELGAAIAEDRFERLDCNEDGVITTDDFVTRAEQAPEPGTGPGHEMGPGEGMGPGGRQGAPMRGMGGMGGMRGGRRGMRGDEGAPQE